MSQEEHKCDYVVLEKIKTAKSICVFINTPYLSSGSADKTEKFEAKEVEKLVLKCTICKNIRIVE